MKNSSQSYRELPAIWNYTPDSGERKQP